MSEFKVMFINKNGESAVELMKGIPNVGHTVPIFTFSRVVSKVVWCPELILKELEGKGVDVLITLETKY